MPRQISETISYYNNVFCCYDSCHILILYKLSLGHYHPNSLYELLCFWGKPPLFSTSFRVCQPAPLGLRASRELLHFLRASLSSRGARLAAAEDGDAAAIPACPWLCGHAAENKATLHGLGRKVTWELFFGGLQLFYASSMKSVYRTFGAWGRGDCDCSFVSCSKLLSDASVNTCHQHD